MAWGNLSAKNPKLMLGQIDTDPRSLKQPELDEFLSWWSDLEKRHAVEGIQIQLRLDNSPTSVLPSRRAK
jgi:hypothetical protein